MKAPSPTGTAGPFLAVVSCALLVLAMAGTASAFHVDEQFDYDLRWIGIYAGKSMMRIFTDEGNKRTIMTTAHSADWISWFYPVEDLAESVVHDEPPWYPKWYHLKTREGRRRKDKEIFFSREEGKAVYVDNLEKESKEFEMPQGVYDPLSAFYQVRFAEIEVGKSSYVPVFDSKKVYDVEIQVLRKETVTVPAGTFDTVLIKPILKSEGIFARKGPILIWLTDDERRIPVKLETEVKVGSISAELKEMKR